MDISSTSDYNIFGYDNRYALDKTKCKPTLCQRIFPSGFKRELKGLIVIFFPLVLTNFFRFLNPMISLIMCGHLSKVEFDAASLANSLINIFGISIDQGFSTAFDTLFAQIYGSDQKKRMGGLLQRAIIIMTLLYFVLSCFHLNIEPFLILLKQDPLISELTAYYILLYLPGLFFDIQFLTISRYLQNQNIVYPMMISSFVGNIFSAVSQYVAIYIFGYKLEASAILQAASCFVMFILQLGYVLITKVYKDTWDGFSLKDSFNNWKLIFALGIPGILMIALEEWNFEIGTFIAGSINGVQLGAQSIAFQCSTISCMMTMGLSIATTIRVGQFLGSREIDSVKTAYRTAFVVGAITSALSCILTIVLRDLIAALFSSDKEIQAAASNLLFLIAFMQIPDIIAGITSGILKACGRQVLGAVVMFICYYLIGIPIGLVLVFVAKLNIEGIWIGLIIALIIEAILFSIFIGRTNWEVECDKAQANIDEMDFQQSFFEEPTEKSPLIVKSDYEGNASWVREKIHNPNKKISKIKKPCSIPELQTKPINRSRSLMILTKHIYKIDDDYDDDNQSFRKTTIRRIIAFSLVLILLFVSILIRIYLPKSLYLPCIPDSDEARANYITHLCKANDTLFENL